MLLSSCCWDRWRVAVPVGEDDLGSDVRGGAPMSDLGPRPRLGDPSAASATPGCVPGRVPDRTAPGSALAVRSYSCIVYSCMS